MSQRVTLDRHTIRSLIDGKCDRIARLGTEPKTGGCSVFRLGQSGGAVCKLTVLDVTPATLDQLVPDGDVRAALEHGAPTTTEFRRRWLSQHDRHVKRMTGDEIADLTEQDIGGFWHDWRPVRVWSMAVRLDTISRERFIAVRPQADRTRLTDQAGFRLHVADGGDLARGYTSTPALGLPGEGAAVDDHTLERFAAEASDRDAARRRRDLFELEKALEAVVWLAGDDRQVRVIRRQIELLRQRSDRRAV